MNQTKCIAQYHKIVYTLVEEKKKKKTVDLKTINKAQEKKKDVVGLTQLCLRQTGIKKRKTAKINPYGMSQLRQVRKIVEEKGI